MSDKLIVGWFRDAQCDPPNWPVRSLKGESVVLPQAAGKRWSVQFYNTLTGKPLGAAVTVDRLQGLGIALPEFSESIAMVARRESPRRSMRL